MVVHNSTGYIICNKYVIILSFICSLKFDSIAIMNMSASAINFPQTLNNVYLNMNTGY